MRFQTKGTIPLILFFLLFIYSCTGDSKPLQEEKQNVNVINKEENSLKNETPVDVKKSKEELIENDLSKNDGIELKTFQNDNKQWGYDVYLKGKMYLHQTNIPAVQGNNGFQTSRDAEKVANFVIGKIRKGLMPPTITTQELDSLGIN